MSVTSLSGKCPVCKTIIGYKVDELAVYCPFCNKNFAVSDLLLAVDKELKSVFIEGVDLSSANHPNQALELLDKYFDNYDWEKYYKSQDLSILELDNITSKFTSEFEALPETWIFSVKSLIVPCNKKLEFFKNVELDIYDGIKGDDYIKVYSKFEVYKKTASDIVSCKDAVLKRMATYYETARKCNASTAIINELYNELLELKEELDAVEEVLSPTQISSCKPICDAMVKIVKQNLASQGVDIESEYLKAKGFLETDTVSAIKVFSTLSWYKDSAEYLFKLGRIFMIENVYLEVSGKKYAIIKEDKQVFDIANLTKNGETNGTEKCENSDLELVNNPSLTTYSLHEVIDGVPALKPTLTGMSKVLAGLGSYVYFIKGESKLCRYDVLQNGETGVVMLDAGDYSELPTPIISSDASKFSIKRPIVVEEKKRGCIKRLFKKKKRVEENKNVYSIIEVDMKYGVAKVRIPELLDVRTSFGDNVIYEYAIKDTDDVDLMVYNLKTSETYKLPTDDCQVYALVGDTVIYGEYAPNEYNVDLYSYNFKEEKLVCLERNVYKYYGYAEGKVFYTVGNEKYKDLFSISVDGTSRVEIVDSPNDDGVLMANYNSFYVGKGMGENAVLLRVSKDGKFKVPVGSMYSKFVSVNNGDIYYVNSNDELAVTSTDGKRSSKIAEGVKPCDEIIANDESVFFLRTEKIENAVKSKSLYRTESNGENVQKLKFNVVSMTNYDDNNLCLLRKVTKYFKVSTPTTLKNYDVTYKKCDITEYVKVNQKTFEEETLLTLGSPDKLSFEFKRGCLRKSVDVCTKVEQITRRDYVRKTGVPILVGEEAVEYDIVMDGVGRDKIVAIKTVKEISNCSILDAKLLVEKVGAGHDTTIKSNLSKSQVEECLQKLKEAGLYGYAKPSAKKLQGDLLLENKKSPNLLKDNTADDDKSAGEEKNASKKSKQRKKGNKFALAIMIILFIALVGVFAYAYFTTMGVPEFMPEWVHNLFKK